MTAPSPGSASVDALRVAFPGVVALDRVSLDVARGEFVTVVGPSNAGKSTLLKTIAGLHRPAAGRVSLDGRDVTALAPRDRGVSLLFQNIALFPTLTGFDNIAFPLRTAGVGEAEIGRRVAEVAALLKVSHLLDRHPRTFSGGEQQRVAIGRSIALPSRLLMLDEPLTNLDARIRIALRVAFKRLHQETGQTVLYVTHDQVEAMSLSDRIAVLHEGRFQQVGTPDEIYHRPANRFVARFMGQPPMNILAAEGVEAGEVPVLVGPGWRLPIAGAAPSPRALPARIELGVRPEAVRAAPVEGPDTPFPGDVVWVERLGAKHVLDVRLGGTALKAVVRPDHPIQSPGPAWFGFEARGDRLIDGASGHFVQ